MISSKSVRQRLRIPLNLITWQLFSSWVTEPMPLVSKELALNSYSKFGHQMVYLIFSFLLTVGLYGRTLSHPRHGKSWRITLLVLPKKFRPPFARRNLTKATPSWRNLMQKRRTMQRRRARKRRKKKKVLRKRNQKRQLWAHGFLPLWLLMIEIFDIRLYLL